MIKEIRFKIGLKNGRSRLGYELNCEQLDMLDIQNSSRKNWKSERISEILKHLIWKFKNRSSVLQTTGDMNENVAEIDEKKSAKKAKEKRKE